MVKLEQMSNQVLELPRMGLYEHRDFVAERTADCMPPILLTDERISIIRRFCNEVNMVVDDCNSESPGMILGGPPGSGKSVTSFLLAATAYANHCFLVYIVRSSLPRYI